MTLLSHSPGAAAAAAALACGAAGGAVFSALGTPLPWTLGSMAGAALVATVGPGWTLPGVFRDLARPVIGAIAGTAFTPAVIGAMAGWWPALVMVFGYLVVTAMAGQVYFRKACGYDRTTALFASMPGGLAEMVLQGSQTGADVRSLVLVHTVRVIIVVSAVPFILGLLFTSRAQPELPLVLALPRPATVEWGVLALCAVFGAFAGKRLRTWGGLMLVPLFLSATVHGAGIVEMVPPRWLLASAQVVVGCISGARIATVRPQELLKGVAQGFAWTVVLLATASSTAVLTARAVEIPAAAVFLAMSPGGFAEMTVIALATGVEVAFVVACHVFRSIAILTGTPILNLVAARGRNTPPPP